LSTYILSLLSKLLRRSKITLRSPDKTTELDDDDTVLDHLIKLTSGPTVSFLSLNTVSPTAHPQSNSLITHSGRCDLEPRHLLPRHPPSVFTCLREEVPSTSYNDIREMKYLRAVINGT
jgi:hypothetical protein